MGYLWMKVFHILFAVLFVGNILLAVFWKRHADKSGNKKIIGHTIKGIVKSDRLFTMPGVTGLIVFGFGAQGIGRLDIATGWIFWSIVLIIISGAAYMAKVVPVQKKMLRLTESGEFDINDYNLLSSTWNLWGMIALITPLIALVLMVLKIPAGFVF
jgi:uncharacterized membrane protein